MKKLIFAIALLSCIVVLIVIYQYNKKHHIQFELFYQVPNEETDFYPMAYIFYHNYNDLASHYRDISKDERIKDVDFDFDNYSYVAVFGRKISDMYYSFKSSCIDDISPSYAKPKGTKFVVVTYEKPNSTGKGGIYYYKIKKDTRLRGFGGL